METVYINKNLELVKACMQGSRAAQFDLYKLYAKAMYNVALRILNYEEEAEDVLQESFLDAFTRIVDFRQETTFGLWLKQIVINKSINYLRKRKMEFVSTDEVSEVPDEVSFDDYDTRLQAEEVRKAITELPDGYRVVLSLYLLEGYDHEEISHILKISENTSRTQYMRAKKKLKSILDLKGMRDE
ncbi:RNA polymerase sigma factor [Pedobacter psychrotolerans]|uniref:DNA-directed RNA polymerase sigma-70 factor n=2 Tax=Pedobacter psychrotolerans TaxID=1843235 RepID=A0ABQ1SSB3_9SPHI|nr:sigma-70 family RNA polymerase sigma factor [Pedobacter psychrotolerans]GGE55924.1 DNA-directed RNA polymerase sigma-70 factor [Pedobacter psychrotolerans]